MLASKRFEGVEDAFLAVPGNIGGMRYDAHCYRPHSRLGCSLSYLPLQSQEGVEASKPLASFVARIARANGVTKLFAPAVVSHSAELVEQKDLTVRLELPNQVKLFRNPVIPADAVPLGVSTGGTMSNAGCPLLVVGVKGYFLFVHASRKNMLDEGLIRDGVPSRRFETVLHAVKEYLEHKGIKPHEIKIHGHFHIDPETFEHPLDHEDTEIAEFNRKMYDFIFDTLGVDIMREQRGLIDMEALVKGVAGRLDFGKVTFTDPLPRNYASTRSSGLGMAPDRNAIFLFRRS